MEKKMTKTEIGFGMIDSNNILQIWTIRKQRKQAKEALKSCGYNDKLIKRYYKPIKVEITYEVKE